MSRTAQFLKHLINSVKKKKNFQKILHRPCRFPLTPTQRIRPDSITRSYRSTRSVTMVTQRILYTGVPAKIPNGGQMGGGILSYFLRHHHHPFVSLSQMRREKDNKKQRKLHTQLRLIFFFLNCSLQFKGTKSSFKIF